MVGKQKMIKKLFLITIIFLGGCSSNKESFTEYVTEKILEQTSGSELSYNGAECYRIKNQCRSSNYTEWKQLNGEISCSCKK